MYLVGILKAIRINSLVFQPTFSLAPHSSVSEFHVFMVSAVTCCLVQLLQCQKEMVAEVLEVYSHNHTRA